MSGPFSSAVAASALPRRGKAAPGRGEDNEVCAKHGWKASGLDSSENPQMFFKMPMIKISSDEYVIGGTRSAPIAVNGRTGASACPAVCSGDAAAARDHPASGMRLLSACASRPPSCSSPRCSARGNGRRQRRRAGNCRPAARRLSSDTALRLRVV